MKIMMPLIMLPLSVHPWSPCRVSHQILHTAQHDTMVLLLILLYSYTNTPTLSTVTKCRSPQKHFKALTVLATLPVSAACPGSGCRVTCSRGSRDTRHRDPAQTSETRRFLPGRGQRSSAWCCMGTWYNTRLCLWALITVWRDAVTRAAECWCVSAIRQCNPRIIVKHNIVTRDRGGGNVGPMSLCHPSN